MSELHNRTTHPYTDLLSHDVGLGLADKLGQDGVTGSACPLAPLWSIGFTAGVSGGEGDTSKEAFRNLTAAERASRIKFLRSL